jgi:hypothetical protein
MFYEGFSANMKRDLINSDLGTPTNPPFLRS